MQLDNPVNYSIVDDPIGKTKFTHIIMKVWLLQCEFMISYVVLFLYTFDRQTEEMQLTINNKHNN